MKEAFEMNESKNYPSDEIISQYLFNEFELPLKQHNRAIKLIEKEQSFA